MSGHLFCHYQARGTASERRSAVRDQPTLSGHTMQPVSSRITDVVPVLVAADFHSVTAVAL